MMKYSQGEVKYNRYKIIKMYAAAEKALFSFLNERYLF